MEKSAYRRPSAGSRSSSYKSRQRKSVRRGGNSRGRYDSPGFDFKQMLLIQCIVSGIILICVLVISIINVPATNTLRRNLKVAINTNVTKEGLEESTLAITGKFSGVQRSIQNFFGGGEMEEPSDKSQPLLEDEAAEAFLSQGNSETGSFRIDEDILEQLSGGAESLEKKLEVPVEP